MNSKDALDILKQSGWVHIRTKGSHYMMKKGELTVPIPYHGTKDWGIDLVKRIEKQTGEKLK